MAGLLDYLMPNGLMGYRLSDDAPKTLGVLGSGAAWLNPIQNLPRLLMDYGGAIGSALGGAIERVPNDRTIPEGGGGSGWGGGPATVAEPTQPVPQFNTPQKAAAAFDTPTGSYQFGQQMVPYYGQSSGGDEVGAQRRGGGTVSGIQINPQGNPVAPAAVSPGATSEVARRIQDAAWPDVEELRRRLRVPRHLARSLLRPKPALHALRA